jgi:hypothetical protein
MNEHVASCATCAELVRRETSLREVMGHYAAAVPVRDEDFFDRMLTKAVAAGKKHEGRTAWFRGLATAAAAGLILWFAASMLLGGGANSVARRPVPTVMMRVEEPQTVNLVFSSPTQLERATLHLRLPRRVEIAGFEGQRQIAWITRLQQGKNVLPLRLTAISGRGGVVRATLRHGGKERVFYVLLRVT